MEEEKITISKSQYEELLSDSKFLDCLRAAGVDNWEGYGDACQQFQEENE